MYQHVTLNLIPKELKSNVPLFHRQLLSLLSGITHSEGRLSLFLLHSILTPLKEIKEYAQPKTVGSYTLEIHYAMLIFRIYELVDFEQR